MGRAEEVSMSHAPLDGHDKNQTHSLDGASVTLRGIVEKIVPAENNPSDAVQIAIEGAESLSGDSHSEPFAQCTWRRCCSATRFGSRDNNQVSKVKVRSYLESSDGQ